MQKRLILLLVTVLLLMAAVPAMAQDGPTVVDIAVRDPNFNVLVAAAQAAGLAETLASEGPFTIFAPTDGAFLTLLAELGVTQEELLADTDLLTQVLLYHVVEGVIPASVITGADSYPLEVQTLNGASISVSLLDDVPILNNGRASVFLPDVFASNGVIHVIDNVLLPPMDAAPAEEVAEEAPAPANTIARIAAGDPNFSTLIDASSGPVIAALNGDGPLTVFAPTNDAFAAALPALGLTPETASGAKGLLENIVLYHAIPGAVLSTDIAGMDVPFEVETASGEMLTVDFDGTTVILNGGQATVTTADLMADNGVIHVIDGVLLPPSMTGDAAEEEVAVEAEAPAPANTIARIAAGDPNFSTLIDASSGPVIAALNGDGPLTVFAPTNDAFAAALPALGLTPETASGAKGLLENIVLYHAIPGAVLSTDIAGMDVPFEVETASGEMLTVDFDGTTVILNGGQATVTTADLMADNGVIHVIDGVLLPPSMTGEMAADDMGEMEEMAEATEEPMEEAEMAEEATEEASS